MIGASKLIEEDAVIIRKMHSSGMNKTEIAKNFISVNGHKISRAHISRIIRGTRWNKEERSFLMKDDLIRSKSISTKFDTIVFQTRVSVLRIEARVLYGYVSYIDSNIDKIHNVWSSVYPDDRTLNNIHSEFVQSYL